MKKDNVSTKDGNVYINGVKQPFKVSKKTIKRMLDRSRQKSTNTIFIYTEDGKLLQSI